MPNECLIELWIYSHIDWFHFRKLVCICVIKLKVEDHVVIPKKDIILIDSKQTWLWIEAKVRAEIVSKEQLLQVNFFGIIVDCDEGFLFLTDVHVL